MKQGRKKFAAGIGALIAVGGIAAAVRWIQVRPVMRPEFPMKKLETVFYTAEYPAHWPDIKAGTSAKDDDLITFQNHDVDDFDESPWDERPLRMNLSNETFSEGDASVDEAVASWMDGGFDPSEVKTVRLNNGIEAKTWTQTHAYIEIAAESRLFAFQAPNGDVYTARIPLPPEWVIRRRYDYIFQNILGSLEFKDRPPGRREPAAPAVAAPRGPAPPAPVSRDPGPAPAPRRPAPLPPALARVRELPPGDPGQFEAKLAVIRIVRGLGVVPKIPAEARDLVEQARSAIARAMKAEDYEAAARNFEEALRIAPWWAKAYYMAGILDREMGRLVEAEKNFTLYLLADPAHPDPEVLAALAAISSDASLRARRLIEIERAIPVRSEAPLPPPPGKDPLWIGLVVAAWLAAAVLFFRFDRSGLLDRRIGKLQSVFWGAAAASSGFLIVSSEFAPRTAAKVLWSGLIGLYLLARYGIDAAYLVVDAVHAPLERIRERSAIRDGMLDPAILLLRALVILAGTASGALGVFFSGRRLAADFWFCAVRSGTLPLGAAQETVLVLWAFWFCFLILSAALRLTWKPGTRPPWW